ncbi:histidine phosphatase family protein [Janibacter alkaliphilus]
MLPVTQVHLVRHGRTTWQEAGRVQGSFAGEGEPVLTDTGREQVHDAAGHLLRSLGRGEVRLVTSDLARAVESATIIAEVLAEARTGDRVNEPQIEPWVDRRWREQHLGTMEGLRRDELAPEPTPEGADVSEIRWAAGESLRDVHDRLRPALVALEATPADVTDVVVVSHEHTIRVALAALRGHRHPWRRVDWSEPLPPGSVRSLSLPVLG